MISAVRSKVASKISKIQEADDFNFSNWLKKPLHEDYPIEELTSNLKELEDIELAFLPASHSQYTFDFFEPEVTDELKNYEFKKIKSNAIFFMIGLPFEKGIAYSDVILKHKSFTEKKVEFLLQNPEIKKHQAALEATISDKLNFYIDLPTNQNYLSNLVPEVFKIDLLDFEDLVTSAKKVKVENIKLEKFKKTKVEKSSLPHLAEIRKVYKIKVPSMGQYKSSEREIPISTFTKPSISDTEAFQVKKVRTWYTDFQFSKLNFYLYYRTSKITSPSSEEAIPEDKIVDMQLNEQLSIILGNRSKLDWEKSGGHLTKLAPHEEEITKFLVETDYALLQDELGIDIQKETIAALKLLFSNKVIRSALIITDARLIGDAQLVNSNYLDYGWSNRLRRYCSEISSEIVLGNNDERADVWNKWKPIVIADMETALNDYRLKILEEKNLDKFDCIILESVDQLLDMKEGKKEFLSAVKPRILWATSNVVDKNLFNELNTLLNTKVQIEKVQNRSKHSITDSLPKFILNEFWTGTDEKQSTEYKSALVECRKDLRRVLESGNPLRFYANIFTLFHKLNQIGNFADNKPVSPKSDLLIHHLKMIKRNKKKALILSQYEKQGTKKIAELLEDNGIQYIAVPNSMSVEEMQKSISTFQSQDEMVAFITDAKISKSKFSNFDVSYIIKFDHWWNPISNWEFEDIFINEEGKQKESINLFNYHVAGTLDQKMKELLAGNDLLNKNVFELMQTKYYEELISVEEWLKVFGMPVSDEVNTEQIPEKVLENLRKTTIDNYRKMLSRLFTVLGFSNVDVLELANSNSFKIIGKSKRNGEEFLLNANVFEERKIEKKNIENILSQSSNSNNNKVFIISRTKIPEIPSNKIARNVTILDSMALSKLLIRVGIFPA